MRRPHLSDPVALLRWSLDRSTIYLPIIVAGALALGTYWLVRNAPKFVESAAPAAPTHQPDSFMRGFVVRNFLSNGQLRTELSGKEGRHYPDTDTFEVDGVRVHAVSPRGLVTRAQADRGVSNADGTEVQLFGNAVVVREAAAVSGGKVQLPMEFRGEFLHAFTDTERVVSDKPVTLTRGKDQFTADAMDYDNLSGVANLTGRVRGVLVPSAHSSSAPAIR